MQAAISSRLPVSTPQTPIKSRVMSRSASSSFCDLSKVELAPMPRVRSSTHQTNGVDLGHLRVVGRQQ